MAFRAGDCPPDVYCMSFEEDLSWDAGFQLVWELAGAGYECSLVVDELLDFSDARSGQDSFRHFIRYGRHRGLNLCYCSMRPVNVDGLLRANVTEVIAFRQNHDADVEALSKIGFIGGRAEETRWLKQFQYIRFHESDVFKLKEWSRNADIDKDEGGRDVLDDADKGQAFDGADSGEDGPAGTG